MNIDFPLIFFIYSNDLQFKFVFIQKITKNKNNYPNIAHKLEKTPCLNMEHYMLCVERRKSWRTKKKKSLPSVKRTTLGKDVRLCRVSNGRHSAKSYSLPSVAGPDSRQRLLHCPVSLLLTLGKASTFVECRVSDTRQRLLRCRVSSLTLTLGKSSSVAECCRSDTRQKLFVECCDPDTRKSVCLCRVPWSLHSANL